MRTDTHNTLRTEIELTRERFHRLLVTIPEDTLKLPSKTLDWTNGEVLYRMSIAPLIIKSTLENKMGKNSQRAPIHQIMTGPLMQRTNTLFIRSRAANSTRLSMAKEYDEICTKILDMLDGISEDDFDKEVLIPESDPLLSGHITVEQAFRYVKNHFDIYRKLVRIGN